MSSDNEIVSSLHLNALRDVGPARFQKLINVFASAENAVRAGSSEWQQISLFDSEVLDRVQHQWDEARITAERDFVNGQRMSVSFQLIHTGVYPERLKQIASPPPVLYVRGVCVDWNRPSVALVGSRKSSYYAEKTAVWLSQDLASAGVVTVSGLARGIDTRVHQSTVDAGGVTWAVLGSGLMNIYPAENKTLAERIVERGLLISEFPFNSRPHPSSFPRRNRIISGLTLGTVVVEGGGKSGSLITARLAADQGREVMAVPGPVRAPGSAAPNLLLKMGATLVESATDIAEAVGLSVKTPETSEALVSADEKRVLREINGDPMSREILSERLQKSAGEMSSLLLEMELRGLVRCLPSGGVVKAV